MGIEQFRTLSVSIKIHDSLPTIAKIEPFAKILTLGNTGSGRLVEDLSLKKFECRNVNQELEIEKSDRDQKEIALFGKI